MKQPVNTFANKITYIFFAFAGSICNDTNGNIGEIINHLSGLIGCTSKVSMCQVSKISAYPFKIGIALFLTASHKFENAFFRLSTEILLPIIPFEKYPNRIKNFRPLPKCCDHHKNSKKAPPIINNTSN